MQLDKYSNLMILITEKAGRSARLFINTNPSSKQVHFVHERRA